MHARMLCQAEAGGRFQVQLDKPPVGRRPAPSRLRPLVRVTMAPGTAGAIGAGGDAELRLGSLFLPSQACQSGGVAPLIRSLLVRLRPGGPGLSLDKAGSQPELGLCCHTRPPRDGPSDSRTRTRRNSRTRTRRNSRTRTRRNSRSRTRRNSRSRTRCDSRTRISPVRDSGTCRTITLQPPAPRNLPLLPLVCNKTLTRARQPEPERNA
jgi:hypothetical protein